MQTTYTTFLRDSATGLGRDGLTPTWATCVSLITGTPIVAPPSITEVGGGWYRFAYDPIAAGPAVGVVDAGAGVVGADRYVAVSLGVDAVERADLAVQLLNNRTVEPASGAGTRAIYTRNGADVMTTVELTNNGVTRTRTPGSAL